MNLAERNPLTGPVNSVQGLPRHDWPTPTAKEPLAVRISRRVFAAAAAAVVLMPLSACGSGGEDGGSTDASGKVEGDITFQTWNLRANFKPYFEGVISDFEKKYPGTHVKWIDQPAEGYADKISADAAGGTLPDVVNVSPDLVAPLAKAGLALDLDKSAAKYKSEYLPGAWASHEIPGMTGTYAFPGTSTPARSSTTSPLRAGRTRPRPAAEDVRRTLRPGTPVGQEDRRQGRHPRQRPHRRGLRPLRRRAHEQGGHRLRLQRREGHRTPHQVQGVVRREGSTRRR